LVHPEAVGVRAFPVVLTIPVAWGEMDAMGHVNNIVYLRWFESARIAYFERLGWLEGGRVRGLGPILHSTQARFRAPVAWPDTVRAGARVSEVGEDRFTMLYEVRSEKLDRVAAEGSGIVVCYDYARGVKTALPDDLKRRISELEAG
jgi:acyl-CoA thioester hydrolase